MNRIMRARPSPAMAVALLALFVALGGTAVALKKNSVKSKQIKNGQVKTQDIGDGEVGSADVQDNGLTGTDVNEPSLDASSFTQGRSAYDDFCDPSSAEFTDCVGATLSLSRSGRVVITAGGGQNSVSALAEGDCRLEVDDATAAIPHSTAVEPGEDDASGDTSPTAQNGFAVTAVTAVLAAGSHTFELSCSQDGGDTAIYDSTISAVMIGSG